MLEKQPKVASLFAAKLRPWVNMDQCKLSEFASLLLSYPLHLNNTSIQRDNPSVLDPNQAYPLIQIVFSDVSFYCSDFAC